MPSTTAATARPPLLFAALLLAAATAVTFAPGLDGPFVGVEARVAIRDNPQLESLWPSPEGLLPSRNSAYTANLAYRPSLSASFALNYAACGRTPRCFHTGNLLLHVTAGLLLLVVLQGWLALPRRPPSLRRRALPVATLIAALWLLHPLQTAVVTYVPGRAEGLAGTLLLASLWAVVRGCKSGSRAWSGLAILAALLAAGSDVSGALALPLGLALGAQWQEVSAATVVRRRPFLHLGLGTAAVLALALANGRSAVSATAPWSHWTAQPEAWLRQVQLFLWPATLQLDSGLGLAPPWLPAAAALLAIGVAGTLWRRLHAESPIVSAAWFLALGLAVHALLPAPVAFAERHAYLARIGMAALVVLVGEQLRLDLAHTALRRTAIYTTMAAIAVALVAHTQARIDDYRTDLGAVAPTLRAAATDEYLAYLRDNPTAAFREWEEVSASGTKPEAGLVSVVRDTYLQMARRHVDAGDEDAAIPPLQRALELAPERVDVHYDLGRILAHGANPAKAEAHLQAAVALAPEHADAHLRLGELLAQRGDVITAREHFAVVRELAARSLESHPDSAEAWCQLGRARRGLDQPERALEAFAEALAADPHHPETLQARLATLLDLGRLADFQQALAQARRILPHDPELERLAATAGEVQ